MRKSENFLGKETGSISVPQIVKTEKSNDNKTFLPRALWPVVLVYDCQVLGSTGITK